MCVYMYACMYVRFCLGNNFLLVLARSLKFSGKLINNLNMCAFFNFGKSGTVSSYERKHVLTISAHLKLQKCSNLTNSFFSCLYHHRLVPDCKWAYSNSFKDFKMGYKNAKKWIFQITRLNWAKFGIKRRTKSKLFRI